MNRIAMLLALNDDFAEAYRNGEKWAIKRLQDVAELDHPTRNFPERNELENGKKGNWCGSCPFADGCIHCDLPYDPKMKGMVGTIALYKIECKSCGYKFGVVEKGSQEEAESDFWASRRHRLESPNCSSFRLEASVVKDPMA